MYFKIAFWELSDDKTMTSYVPDSTIYYCADGSDYQYNVTGLTAGKQYKITISYDNGNKYYVTGGLKVEGLGSTELNTYGDRLITAAMPPVPLAAGRLFGLYCRDRTTRRGIGTWIKNSCATR
jgi:hypothetical protein